MKSTTAFQCVFILLSFFSCAIDSIKTVHDEKAEAANKEAAEHPKNLAEVKKSASTLTDEELSKFAYEIGLDPTKNLSSEEVAQVEKRKKLRTLERSLDSQKERINYSKVLPWLQDDEEKITYLSIPSVEGRQAWINKNKIWKRAKNSKDYQDIMEATDIALGMPSDLVKKAWGDPDAIESSGNPIYKNERWKYIKQVSTPNGYRQEKRYVYFEGGRVVGWETE